MNSQNGKIYVGKTINNFGDRRDCHFASYDGGYGCNPELQREWDQYGRDAFEFVVLEECSSETLKMRSISLRLITSKCLKMLE